MDAGLAAGRIEFEPHRHHDEGGTRLVRRFLPGVEFEGREDSLEADIIACLKEWKPKDPCDAQPDAQS